MGLERRLDELLDAGYTEMAESLAKGAIGSQDIIDFEVIEDGLHVETKSWIGTHTIRPRPRELRERLEDQAKDNPSIRDITIQRSEYSLKADTVEYTITGSQAHYDAIEEYLEEEFCTQPEPRRSRNPFSEPDETETTESTSEGEPSQPRNPFSESGETETADSTSDDEAPQSSESESPISDGGRPQSWHQRVIHALQQYLP